MTGSLRNAIHNRQFNPRFLGIFLTPYFLSRRALWSEIRKASDLEAGGRLLDVGCGSKPYRALFDVREYVGLELDSGYTRGRGFADSFYDGSVFPFQDGEFDSVLCNQVLEHVFNPETFVRELARVLRPGGKLILTVPFVWDEHEQPHDFARYTSFGLKALLESAGFKVESQRKTLSDMSVLFQLLNAYLFKVFRPKSPFTYLLLSSLVCAPLSLFGLAAGAIFPGNEDLFLDQVVVAAKRTP